jgi:hypothetical protein
MQLTDSMYVSTTDSFNSAFRQARVAFEQDPNLEFTQIYVLERPPTAFSFDYPSLPPPLDGLSWEHEVLVPYGVPSSSIVGAFEFPRTMSPYSFRPNPFYGAK